MRLRKAQRHQPFGAATPLCEGFRLVGLNSGAKLCSTSLYIAGFSSNVRSAEEFALWGKFVGSPELPPMDQCNCRDLVRVSSKAAFVQHKFPAGPAVCQLSNMPTQHFLAAEQRPFASAQRSASGRNSNAARPRLHAPGQAQ